MVDRPQYGSGVPKSRLAVDCEPRVANAGVQPSSSGDLAGASCPGIKRPLVSLDLFGDPVLPPRGCGRPRHAPTAELRAKVAQLHREGLSQPKIALAIGITIPTLVLNYPSELESSSRAAARRIQRDLEKL
jgi:hypothetical protein